jgi:hypothetical protein
VNEADALLLRAARGDTRGADAVWAAARQRHRHHPLLLGAALVLFVAAVVAVAAVSIASRTTDDSQPFVTTPAPTEVTATAIGAQLSTSVTVSSAELRPEQQVVATMTFTNQSPEALAVADDAWFLTRLRWLHMPVELVEPAGRLGIDNLAGGGSVVFRGIDDLPGTSPSPGGPSTVVLAPGESTTIVGELEGVDELPAGEVTLTVTPLISQGGSPGGGSFLVASDAQVEFRLTVPPRREATVNASEAERLVFAHPRVAEWLGTPHEGWPSGSIPETTTIFTPIPTPEGWRFTAGIVRDDPPTLEGLVDGIEQTGLPGFIVHVDRHGEVTVEYLVE